MKVSASIQFQCLLIILFAFFSCNSWSQTSNKLNLGASFGYANNLSYTEFNHPPRIGSGKIASVHAELKLSDIIAVGVHASLLLHLSENTDFNSWVESGFTGYASIGYLSSGSHSRLQIGLFGIIGGTSIILDNTVWDGSLVVGLNPTVRYKIHNRISIIFDYRWIQGLKIAPRGGIIDSSSFNLGFSIGIF